MFSLYTVVLSKTRKLQYTNRVYCLHCSSCGEIYRHIFTDKTLDAVFSRFRGFSFTKTLWQKPQGVTRMLFLCLLLKRGMCITPFDFCLRVIVNEKLENLEKTTSTVLSVLLLTYVFAQTYHVVLSKIFFTF